MVFDTCQYSIQTHEERGQMKKLMISICAFFLALSIPLSVSALQFTLDSYSIDANAYDPGLVIQAAEILSEPYSFDLNLGGVETVDLFKIWTDETDVGGDDLIEQSISASFSFTEPVPPFGGTQEGETVGTSDWFFIFEIQTGQLTWDGPKIYNFGPLSDGELLITLSDVTFNWGLYGLTEGYCSGGIVKATFEYLTEASVQVTPEPSTFLLLGLGFGAFGLIARRGRKKAL